MYNKKGEPWSRLLVPGVYGAAHRLEAFLAKWRFGALTVRPYLVHTFVLTLLQALAHFSQTSS